MSAELFLVSIAAGLPSVLPVEVRDGLATEDVSPGVIGFLVTLALVLACIPLFRSMAGKIRGVEHRESAGEPMTDPGPGADEGRPDDGAGKDSGPDAR